MSTNKNHGEGNPEAAREYNEATQEFIDKGKVDKAAEAAAPANMKEREEMEQAEKDGKSRAAEFEKR